MPFLLFTEKPFYLYVLLPLLAFPESLIFPTASTLVSNLSDKEAQGEIFGIHNSIQWAAIGIAPLFSGSAVALYPYLPITVARTSITMFLATITFFWFWKRRSAFQENI